MSSGITIYEQPLSERIRSFLRLEHLFAATDAAICGSSTWDSRSALAGMIDISDLLTRSDIKAELIKELERHLTVLEGWGSNPGVDQEKLAATAKRIGGFISELKLPGTQPGQRIRGDELLNQVRQRQSIPGGTCCFDLPSLHYWLNHTPPERIARMNTWMEDLRILQQGIETVLGFIRESTQPRQVSVDSGFYQQQLDSASLVQIVRVMVPTESRSYAEISGGKHRFSVRFFTQPATGQRAEQITTPLTFELQCCGI